MDAAELVARIDAVAIQHAPPLTGAKGRPRLGDVRIVRVRIPTAVIDAIDRIALRADVNRSEAIRIILEMSLPSDAAPA